MRFLYQNTQSSKPFSNGRKIATAVTVLIASFVTVNIGGGAQVARAASLTISASTNTKWNPFEQNPAAVIISGTTVTAGIKTVRIRFGANGGQYDFNGFNQFTVGSCPNWLNATIGGSAAHCYISGSMVSLSTSDPSTIPAGTSFSATFAIASIKSSVDVSINRTINVDTYNGDHFDPTAIDSGTTQLSMPETVTFNANGGLGTMTNQVSSTAATLTKNTFTRAGYRFDGWAAFNGGPLLYADEAEYPFTSSRTLWARWVQPTVTASQSFVPATATQEMTTVTLTAENFTSPITTFSLRSGTLPDGIVITKTGDYTATISGTPTAAANGCFHFDATNGIETAGTSSCIIIDVAAAPAGSGDGDGDGGDSGEIEPNSPPSNNNPNTETPSENTGTATQPNNSDTTQTQQIESNRSDSITYSRKLPTRVQTNTTLNVLTKKASRTQSLRSRTPKICVTSTQSVVMVNRGTCTVQVMDKATGKTVRTLSTKVRSTEVEVGTTVDAEDPIYFSRASTRLSAAAKAQIAELAANASSAKRIILVGHTAVLTEATASNNFISLQRSARVKAALQAEFKKAGVTVPIIIVSLGSKAPVTTKKTESAQTQNRRVNVYIVP